MRRKIRPEMGCLLVIILALVASVAAQDRLGSGEKLKAGDELKSQKGMLVMRHVGNLTLYDKDHNVEWESRSYINFGQRVEYLQMNRSGDLEIIVKDDDTGQRLALWSSKTSAQHGAEAVGAHLEIDWDNFILKIVSTGGKELWRSQ